MFVDDIMMSRAKNSIGFNVAKRGFIRQGVLRWLFRVLDWHCFLQNGVALHSSVTGMLLVK